MHTHRHTRIHTYAQAYTPVHPHTRTHRQTCKRGVSLWSKWRMCMWVAWALQSNHGWDTYGDVSSTCSGVVGPWPCPAATSERATSPGLWLTLRRRLSLTLVRGVALPQYTGGHVRRGTQIFVQLRRKLPIVAQWSPRIFVPLPSTSPCIHSLLHTSGNTRTYPGLGIRGEAHPILASLYQSGGFSNPNNNFSHFFWIPNYFSILKIPRMMFYYLKE